MRLLPQHKWLLLLTGLIVVMAAAVYLTVIRPQRQALNQARERKQRIKNELAQTGWPLNVERLEQVKEDEQHKLRLLRKRAQKALRQGTGMYQSRIQRIYRTKDDFLEKASRLDYQEQHNRVEQNLRDQGVNLYGEVLGVTENTSSPFIYQLMLKLWTVEIVAEKVTNSGLDVARSPDITFRDRFGNELPASQIQMLPMKAYVTKAGISDPYLLEFPVKVAIRGRIEDFMRLMESLNATPEHEQTDGPEEENGDNEEAEADGAEPEDGENTADDEQEGDVSGTNDFIPLSHLELKKIPPALRRGEKNSRQIRGHLILSGFFRMEGGEQDADEVEAEESRRTDGDSRPPLGF